jgi:hypothetical protein
MSRGILLEILFILLLPTLIFKSGYSQVVSSHPVRIMFYNVENFFDIYDDSLTDDNEFLPDGLILHQGSGSLLRLLHFVR